MEGPSGWLWFLWAGLAVWVFLDAYYKKNKTELVSFLWGLITFLFGIFGALAYFFITFAERRNMQLRKEEEDEERNSREDN